MSGVPCFFMEPAERVRLSLRIFIFERYGKCYGPKGWGYHDSGSVPIGDAPVLWDPTHGDKKILALRPEHNTIPHDDSRWPKKCADCAHVFGSPPPEVEEVWQVNQDLYYRRVDTGEEMTDKQAPPGAMWWATWMEGSGWTGADGKCLAVKLPDGQTWLVDGPANNAPDKMKPGWTRTGVPPKVTASPSILTSKYHGWLRDGMLVVA